jgi:hypothetical protein
MGHLGSRGFPRVTWGISAEAAARGIMNGRGKPFSVRLPRRCSERGGRLHPFLRQPEMPLAIFLIFEGKEQSERLRQRDTQTDRLVKAA